MNTMLSSEVWQDIQGYSGIYQVSTLGRIRSLKKGKIKLLKPYINNMGYAVLSLYANHKQKTYHVHKLVYFETTPDVRAAIEREKQIKSWSRKRKDALIATMNPKWVDLSADWEM